MIQIIIGNNRAKLIGLSDSSIRRDIDIALSYKINGYQFMNVRNNWDGRYRLLDKRNGFPIGMLSVVENILKVNHIEYSIIDNRDVLQYGKEIKPIVSKFEIRDYQQDIINKCLSYGSGIVRLSTGGGKSLILSSVAAKLNIPTVIYVISIDLLYQMADTFKKAFGIDVGIIGDGICEIKQINIMTIWSAARAFDQKITFLDEDIKKEKKDPTNKAEIREVVSGANLVILDECQYAGSDTFQFLASHSLSAKHRFLFSGTPWRENGDDILLEAVAGKKIVDIDASFLINQGFLVKPEITFKSIPTKRGAGKTYQEVYKNCIIDNEFRNSYIVNACKKLVDSDKQVLLLFSKISHGKHLQDLLEYAGVESHFLDGSKSSKERNEKIELAKKKEIKVLLASAIFDQGIDIPSLDALILCGGGKSSARSLQRIGRVIRPYPGKSKAFILDFYDQCKFLRDHSEARYRTYSTEKEFRIKRIE